MTVFIHKEGNLLNDQAEVLVNAVNRLGFMGAGIALAFKLRFPKMFQSYKESCKNGAYDESCLTLYKDQDKVIANLRTVDDKLKGQYSLVNKGLMELRDAMLEQGLKTVAIPPLGCGIGGLDSKQVLKAIMEIFQKTDITVYLYNFRNQQAWRSK